MAEAWQISPRDPQLFALLVIIHVRLVQCLFLYS